MSKVKKLFLIITGLVSILGTFSSQAELPADPESAPITLGQWHSSLSKGIAYSDANDVPMVLVWGQLGCSNCSAFDSDLQSSTFTTWQANRQIVMIYVKNPYGSAESKWARGIATFQGTPAPRMNSTVFHMWWLTGNRKIQVDTILSRKL